MDYNVVRLKNILYLCQLKTKNDMDMKKIIIATALVGMAMVIVACGNKKKSNDIIAQRVVKTVPKTPERMQEYTDERDVEWIGKTYHVSVHRQPSDSLPMVKDETGRKFVDNVFTVAVSRQDGSVFYSRTFTKRDLAQYINHEFQTTGIMEGFVFDKADGDWLVFAASVGHPDTDEYIPLQVRLSRMGVLEIKLDSQLDTSPSTEDEEV